MKLPFAPARAAPLVACVMFVAAVAGFGLSSPDFGQSRHPVALLGAAGEPNALAFNLAAFVLPGALLAWSAIGLRARSDAASWTLRVGLQLALLSALAFAAQGVLPLDPYDLTAPASRLHALAWTLWWVAFVPGALLVAAGQPRKRVAGFAFAVALPVFALFGAMAMPAAITQRIAYLLWFAWWIVVSADPRPREAMQAPL